MTIKATIEIESGNSKGFICLLATVIKKNRSKKKIIERENIKSDEANIQKKENGVENRTKHR